MSNYKNYPDELPDCPDCIENQIEVKHIEERIEINDEVPVKKKRKYEWKGDKTRKRSAEHNAKIAKALSGRQLSEEHRHAIAEAMIGNDNFK